MIGLSKLARSKLTKWMLKNERVASGLLRGKVLPRRNLYETPSVGFSASPLLFSAPSERAAARVGQGRAHRHAEIRTANFPAAMRRVPFADREFPNVRTGAAQGSDQRERRRDQGNDPQRHEQDAGVQARIAALGGRRNCRVSENGPKAREESGPDEHPDGSVR